MTGESYGPSGGVVKRLKGHRLARLGTRLELLLDWGRFEYEDCHELNIVRIPADIQSYGTAWRFSGLPATRSYVVPC
jgi:hypothetical protein